MRRRRPAAAFFGNLGADFVGRRFDKPDVQIAVGPGRVGPLLMRSDRFTDVLADAGNFGDTARTAPSRPARSRDSEYERRLIHSPSGAIRNSQFVARSDLTANRTEPHRHQTGERQDREADPQRRPSSAQTKNVGNAATNASIAKHQRPTPTATGDRRGLGSGWELDRA